MSVINCEERTSRPIVNLLELRLYDIEYDGDSVLVVVSNHTLMRVGSIGHHYTVFFGRVLCWVVVLFEFSYLFLFHFFVLFSLTHGHLHSPILHYVIRT